MRDSRTANPGLWNGRVSGAIVPSFLALPFRAANPTQDRRPVARAKKKTEPRGESKNGNGANLGFEAQLFLAADKLRNNLEKGP